MTKQGHYTTGIIWGAALTALSPWVALGCFLGSRLPDQLEITYKKKGKNGLGYGRIINHRTLTHWLPLWLVGTYFLFPFALQGGVEGKVALGLVLGGVLHLVYDIMSPMGIPLLTPLGSSRVSIPVYKTGKYTETLMIGLSIPLAAGLYLYTPKFLNNLTLLGIS